MLKENRHVVPDPAAFQRLVFLTYCFLHAGAGHVRRARRYALWSEVLGQVMLTRGYRQGGHPTPAAGPVLPRQRTWARAH
jgi:hypothetical protein